MRNIKYFLLILSLGVGSLLSCNNKTAPAEAESGFIEVTTKQFNTDEMQLGTMETVTFEKTVKCNGRIIAPPDGQAQASSPVSGMIKKILCSTGQMVTLNQALVEISGNEIIDLQRDFAESSAQLKKLKSEYVRSKALFQDKIMTEKEFIAAESDYKTTLARFNGLKLKVETLGFSTAKIENGDYYTSYFVKSPIRGFVQEIKVNVGGFIDPHTPLAEITDPQKFQLELSVFGKDINSLRKGQIVRYKTVDESDWKQAVIQTIGIAVQEDSKTIECIASFSANQKSLTFVNTFVEC
ncbi:MAG TPA: efflux RND transporter periplasmic adaptor subunit, partial [Saprospiraceae bacterium]|nr:efflux RND transporter periplasmic adaptor subunit [Saprospiraceae bacterium]